MSTEPAGRSRVEGQNQPVGRRRSTPSATSSSSTAVGRRPAEHVGHVPLGQRQLGGRAHQLRREHVGVVRVEHAPLDRRAEQRLRVVHQVGVHRVVAGDEHDQGLVAGPSGPARLLPERRPRAGEAGHDHGVQPGDVDAQLQRVRGGHAEQLAGLQRRLQRPALLGQVAAAVRRDLPDQLRVDVGQHPLRAQRGQLGAPPGPHERQRARPLQHQVGQHPGGLGAGGPAHRGPVLPGRARAAAAAPRARSSARPPGSRPRSPRRPTRPVSRDANSAGSATVAEASTIVGRAPYRAQIRSSRRSSSATCEPKTPR